MFVGVVEIDDFFLMVCVIVVGIWFFVMNWVFVGSVLVFIFFLSLFMFNFDFSILVVDDVKFFSVMIGCVFSQVGYQDICFVSSVSEVLQQFE